MTLRKTMLRQMIDAVMRGEQEQASAIMNEYTTVTTRSIIETTLFAFNTKKEDTEEDDADKKPAKDDCDDDKKDGKDVDKKAD